MRTDVSGYTIVADVRRNSSGRENLFYNGHKFNKNGRNVQSQLWQCTKHGAGHCKATASTMEIDGVVMMKVFNSMHSHAPV